MCPRKSTAAQRRQISRLVTTRTLPLGDLVVVVFDSAASFSSDPAEVSELTAMTLDRLLAERTKTRLRLRWDATSARGAAQPEEWA